MLSPFFFLFILIGAGNGKVKGKSLCKTGLILSYARRTQSEFLGLVLVFCIGLIQSCFPFFLMTMYQNLEFFLFIIAIPHFLCILPQMRTIHNIELLGHTWNIIPVYGFVSTTLAVLAEKTDKNRYNLTPKYKRV